MAVLYFVSAQFMILNSFRVSLHTKTVSEKIHMFDSDPMTLMSQGFLLCLDPGALMPRAQEVFFSDSIVSPAF